MPGIAKKRSRSNTANKSSKGSIRNGADINPRNAKIVLLTFGIGPLLLMAIFLTSKGFF